MNKSTHVILLGAFTLAFGFIGCGAAEDIENSATAGHTSAGSVGMAGSPATAAGGHSGTTATTAGAPPTSIAGSPTTTVPNAPASSGSSGCSLRSGASSSGALGGLALGLALALAARRRVRKPGEQA